MDAVDQAILQHLKENSRLSIRRLSQLVHLTPPAVTERMRRLEDRGIITGYTVRVDQSKIIPMLIAYVGVLMKSNDHARFLEFVRSRPEVLECHRISGDGCYLLRLEAPDHAVIDAFLDRLLPHANYRLNLVLSSPVRAN